MGQNPPIHRKHNAEGVMIRKDGRLVVLSVKQVIFWRVTGTFGARLIAGRTGSRRE
jgi:hypothetical protein